MNLAGREDADYHILDELRVSRITAIVGDAVPGEVPSQVTGRLGPFSFVRRWYYYSVAGDVPLHVAVELYGDPLGKRDVRVAGHCGCPPPEPPWVTWRLPCGGTVVPLSGQSESTIRWGAENEYAFSDDPASLCATPVISSYHIDSEAGLRLFADTIKRHGLAKP